MVEVRVGHDGEPRRIELDRDKHEITIGRVPQNDVSLPRGNVSQRHARVVLMSDKLVIVDLKSTNGTYVNGRKVTNPQVLREADKVFIGDFSLEFWIEDNFEHEDTLEVDATELRLLSGVAQHEEGSRLVYADWLEAQGDVTRAEFLRIQETIPRQGDNDFSALAARLRELSEHIDPSWRNKVARPLIEGCQVGFELECPKDWGSLSSTEKSSVRFCGACHKRVYYCGSVLEARSQAQQGHCVAVDIVAIRRPHDLEPEQPMRMGMIMPYSAE